MTCICWMKQGRTLTLNEQIFPNEYIDTTYFS